TGGLAEGQPEADARNRADQRLVDIFHGLDEMRLAEDEVGGIGLDDGHHGEFHGCAPVGRATQSMLGCRSAIASRLRPPIPYHGRLGYPNVMAVDAAEPSDGSDASDGVRRAVHRHRFQHSRSFAAAAKRRERAARALLVQGRNLGDGTGPVTIDFSQQRGAGMKYIAASALVAILLWLAVEYLMPPLEGMEDLGGRMMHALKCWCLAVLFCLVTGVEAVADERLSSPAFDPLAGFETRRLRVNERYLQNTLEQTVVFAAA